MCTDEIFVHSWIGSLNAFLVISGGLIAGRLYDRGYLCVRSSFSTICSLLNLDALHSYHLLYGGSLLLAFSLFMLSLAKPNQYYQVLGSVLSHLHACHMLNALVL